ncbi:MAG: hypothetical protein RMI34_07370 [Chloroherpetonaceae bacterium]|nr:hypothetical protein [Chloroherpetonaceae bacterium]MCS7210129.1 hypothetical protein [Chloroherpetonaceae bacterium]MDW8019879.1 hypothetical protein [Chloroherpetonaceae bacterium]MDW8467067.1 hypothetical protein [Chloroherpetonaceae bacterium]
MLKRETFVMKLFAYSESETSSLKIQLQRSASGETVIFSSVEELARYIERWARQQTSTDGGQTEK